MLKKFALIVAGGSGARMESKIPKQFLLLGGKPVLMRTIEQFFNSDNETEIVVVLPKNHVASWKELCSRYEFKIKHSIVEGGETRFNSVKNGLTSITEDGVVAIHDGVRPLISTTLINKLFSEATKKGAAVPAVAVPDSMRSVQGEKNFFVDRSKFKLIQTPQCFTLSVIQKAYRQPYRMTFTDDANVAEADGTEIHLVPGETGNIKITTQEDLAFAEMLLSREGGNREIGK